MTTKHTYKSFKKTWLILDEGTLFIFLKEKVNCFEEISLFQDFKNNTPNLAEDLTYCSLQEGKPPKENKKDKCFYFELNCMRVNSGQSSQYIFQTDTEEEKMDWYNLLDYTIHFCKKRTADQKARVSMNTSKYCHQLLHHDIEGRSTILKELQQSTDNCACCDCNSANPDWVVEKIGAIVCLQVQSSLILLTVC